MGGLASGTRERATKAGPEFESFGVFYRQSWNELRVEYYIIVKQDRLQRVLLHMER